MSAVIIKALKVLKTVASYVFTLEEETRNNIITAVVAFTIMFMLLPALFVTYLAKHPIDTVTRLLSYTAGRVIQGISSIFNNDNDIVIVIDPSNIAPMGEDKLNDLLEEGKKHLGLRYVYGGDSPARGFDCSSYVCYVYTQSGVKNMPRTSAQAIFDNYTVRISSNEAKAGDLIFFHSTYYASSTITHVGIYLGDNYMLHCGGSDVNFTRTNSNYWTNHFYAFGRIID